MPFSSIGVGQPERHGHGLKDSYITFRVQSVCEQESFSVVRRYSDFSDLASALHSCLPSLILPILPEKHSLTQLLGGDRFNPRLVKRRQVGLGRWLQRLAEHHRVSSCPVFREFMMSSNALPDYFQLASQVSNSQIASDAHFEEMSESEEQFTRAKEEIDLLSKHLKALSKPWSNEHRSINYILISIDRHRKWLAGLSHRFRAAFYLHSAGRMPDQQRQE